MLISDLNKPGSAVDVGKCACYLTVDFWLTSCRMMKRFFAVRAFLVSNFIVALALLGTSISMAQSTSNVTKIFESKLAERGIEFVKRTDGRYDISMGQREIIVSLDNLQRTVARDQSEAAVSQFVDTILSMAADVPDWAEARKYVFPMIEDARIEVGIDTISKPLSDQAQLILVYFNETAGTLRFIDKDQAASWGVSLDELWQVSESNLDAIMLSTDIAYIDAGEFAVGVIEAHEPHKASLLRALSLRGKIEPQLGWPIYAVAPSRGFVFLLSKSDAAKLDLIGATVVTEYNSAEYPISTEVWEVGDDGIQAVGNFPAE